MEGVSFITPMQLWNIGGTLSETQDMPAINAEASLFKNVFKNTVNQVKETQADVEYKQYLLSTGQLDDRTVRRRPYAAHCGGQGQP